MIGEILSVINSNPQLRDTSYLRHKFAVGRTVVTSLPESAKTTAENLKTSKSRALGATALVAANAVLLYGDDIAFYNVFSRMKDGLEASTSNGTAIAMIAAGGLSAVTQAALARKNQNFMSNGAVIEQLLSADVERNTESFTERMRHKLHKAKEHAGKLAVSLSIGVSMNVLSKKLSKKEVYVHSVAYGAASALLFEATNVSLGALDNPAAPAILVGGILASRYVSNVCDRAVQRAEAMELAYDTPMISEDIPHVSVTA